MAKKYCGANHVGKKRIRRCGQHGRNEVGRARLVPRLYGRPKVGLGKPRVRLTPDSPGVHAAQGGVTLRLEQGEPRADFTPLSSTREVKYIPSLMSPSPSPCSLTLAPRKQGERRGATGEWRVSASWARVRAHPR